MRKQKKSGLSKKMTGGFLVAIMVISGVACLPKEAKATEASNANRVIYSDDYDIKECKNTNTTPVMEDYIFGGWYADDAGQDYLTEAEATAIVSGADTTTTAYAKFVPAYVLSVKAQNAEGTVEGMTEDTSVRIITSVDSKNYQKVGFEIYLGNGTERLTQDDGEPLETSRVYKGIRIGTGDTAKTKTATEIFGALSQHVAVWELTDIASDKHDKIICVRPYWETMDGTIVYGLAKYVHIEDDYKNYISVPVNLMTGEIVAAGMMNMTYTAKDASGQDVLLELPTDSADRFEAGRLLPEMEYSPSTDSASIKMVGNARNVTDVVKADGIYANIRFIKPDTACTVTFTMTSDGFCDWDEHPIGTVKAWDIIYEVAESNEQ